MKKLLISLFLILFTLTLLFAASPKNVSLVWNANSESDLSGYKVYYGVVGSGITNTVISAGLSTNHTLLNLTNGMYWFAVTATTTNNMESDFSNIIQASIPNNPKNLKIP